MYSTEGRAKEMPMTFSLFGGHLRPVFLILLIAGCGTTDDDEEYTIGGGSGASVGVGLGGSGDASLGETDGGDDEADSMVDTATQPPTGEPKDLPIGSSCEVIADAWPTEWVRFEDAVLAITNEYRAQSIDCRSGGLFPPALPLQDDPLLRCAARRHSLDMYQRSYFDHISLDGSTPSDRVLDVGYTFRAIGENIAAGQRTPQDVVDGWIASDGHCANLMNPNFEELGTGYLNATSNVNHYWTQVFGTPN